MLNPELFFAFLLASAALILLPGPVVTFVVAQSLARGRGAGLAVALGAGLGNALLVTAGAVGLTAVLALLADVFEWIRWAGVAYLVWLGLRAWRQALRPDPDTAAMEGVGRHRGVFWQAVFIAVTNPKTILFYAAFFPQFVDPALALWPQLLAMSAAMTLIGIAFDSCYAFAAGRVRHALADSRRARIRHGITGTLLIGTGIGLAFARRAP